MIMMLTFHIEQVKLLQFFPENIYIYIYIYCNYIRLFVYVNIHVMQVLFYFSKIQIQFTYYIVRTVPSDHISSFLSRNGKVMENSILLRD